jgi:hypothetical protein
MIQYQTLNPYSEIMPGIATGIQLGNQMAKKQPAQPSDAIIADPGQYQPVEIDAVMTDVNQDLQKYNEVENKIKSFKVKPERKKQAMENYANSGVFKSPLVQALAKTGRSFEEINTVFTNVKNGSPEAKADIQLLIDSSDGDPKLKAAIQAKMAEYNQLDTQNKQSRVKVLSETLDNINTVQDKMGQYQGKSGIMNPQTKKVVDNEMNYLKELTMLDPKAAEEHFGKIKARATGGGSKTWMQSVDKKTGKLITDRVSSREEFLTRNPLADQNQLYPAMKMNESAPIVAQAKVKSEEFKKETADLPEAPEQDAEPDDATKKLFLEKARDPKTKKIDVKKAEKMLKSKGWSIE